MATIYFPRMSTISNSSAACTTVGLVNSQDEPGSAIYEEAGLIEEERDEMDSGGFGVRRPVTQAVCFSVFSVLTMMISELRTRALPVQDPLSVSGAGLCCVVGQQILEVSYVGWKWVRTHTGEQSPDGLILTNPGHGDWSATR